MVHDSPCDLLANGPSSRGKHLDKIFQICHMGFSMACFGNLFATYFSLKKRVFYVLRVIFWTTFKNFSFFPRLLWLFIVLFVPLPPKLTMFSQKSSIFIIISSQIFKKRYGFSLFLQIFHVSSPRFLGFCVFVWDLKICCWIWFVDILLSLLNGVCWFW